MENNRRIEISRRIYAGLLGLYPAEHRAEYGADMLQVFTDQCRAACQAGRWAGLLVLWVRTLIDLGISVLREQITAPHAALGLLEPVPNRPLPWKSVALVLIPGLIFFVGQVGQLTGEEWFYWLTFRAAYYLIVPVLVVWAWKRRFPIWGLVPLGLLCRTLGNFVYRWLFLVLDQTNPMLGFMYRFNHTFKYDILQPDNLKIAAVAGLLLVIIWLFGLTWRKVGIPRGAWAVLVVYSLLVVAYFLVNGQDYLFNGFNRYESQRFVQTYLFYQASYDFLTYGGFLALILFGALLSRRHGRLAVLLPLGYLLPTILYGRISNEWPGPATAEYQTMLSVSVGILVYRFIVALAGPLWVVRSATGQKQKLAGMISLAALLLIQASFNLAINGSGVWPSLILAYFALAEPLILTAGVILALVLYRPFPEGQATQTGGEKMLRVSPPVS